MIIPPNGSATAVVLNHYTPSPVSVDLDLVIDKNFADESVASHLQGGAFTFKVQKFNAAEHLWTDLATDTIFYEAGQFGHKSVTIADVLRNEVYSEIGTYSYRVFEEKGNVTNITYDRIIYTFDVIVTDNGGQLEAKVVDINNAELKNQTGDGALDYVTHFTNTYDTAPVSMDIVKVVDNKSGDNTVSAAGFKFKSVTVDKNGNPLDPDAAETPVNTVFSDAAGEARISGVYTKEQIGTHYYIVSEADDGKAGWTYSQAQYFVTVVVAEKENGGIFATMTVEPYNDAAKKEQAPTVTDSNQGLLYFTNASADVQDVQISDVIPENTTYVEGSADTGGVYENGKLLWNVEAMPAWSTVTVSFKVTVNQGIGAVTIDNRATATDGVNSYETNQVTNHTKEKPVDPDVPKPTDPTTPEIPKTDDNMNLQLWCTILLISCGALITVLNFGKKSFET